MKQTSKISQSICQPSYSYPKIIIKYGNMVPLDLNNCGYGPLLECEKMILKLENEKS